MCPLLFFVGNAVGPNSAEKSYTASDKFAIRDRPALISAQRGAAQTETTRVEQAFRPAAKLLQLPASAAEGFFELGDEACASTADRDKNVIFLEGFLAAARTYLSG
jgi:hypothetical protein